MRTHTSTLVLETLQHHLQLVAIVHLHLEQGVLLVRFVQHRLEAGHVLGDDAQLTLQIVVDLLQLPCVRLQLVALLGDAAVPLLQFGVVRLAGDEAFLGDKHTHRL